MFENKAKMRRPLPGLPDVLAASNNDDKAKDASDQSPQTIYRVVGGRKHVQKSEASMQTEPSLVKLQSVEQPYDWKKAMAHNARVLSSQERAMDEYLRRQRASAEQHMLRQTDQVVHLGGNEGLLSLQVGTVGPGGDLFVDNVASKLFLRELRWFYHHLGQPNTWAQSRRDS